MPYEDHATQKDVCCSSLLSSKTTSTLDRTRDVTELADDSPVVIGRQYEVMQGGLVWWCLQRKGCRHSHKRGRTRMVFIKNVRAITK